VAPARRKLPKPEYFGGDTRPLFSTGSMLILGDNLETLPIWVDSESVDLIYLDPPFNSSATYNMLFSHKDGTPAAAQIRAFTDSWEWNDAASAAYDEALRAGGDAARVLHGFWEMLDGGCDMLAYLSMMAPRLVELRRVLKPTGSIYLHCDPTASHYLKLLMDAVFGTKNFRNEIIWHYRRWTGSARSFLKMHDTIFFYSKSDDYTFNRQFTEYTAASLKRKQNYHTRIKGDDVYVTHIDDRGVGENDVWQIPLLNSQAKERVGYPTQKPLALLEKIIVAGSNPGDLVLDPFCGCGTAVDAAENLGRRWIGIDIARLATDVIEERLHREHPGIRYDLRVFPPTIEEAERLAETDRHAFQEWACFQIGATPTGKGADRGIDGVIDGYVQGKRWRALVSVKSGQTVKVSELRDLLGTVDRERAQTGIFVTLAEPPRTFAKDVAETGLGDLRIPRLQVVTVAELFTGKRPAIPAPAGVAQFDLTVPAASVEKASDAGA
jgi:site-specific DNA-methyltransferase (adenine-specific)